MWTCKFCQITIDVSLGPQVKSHHLRKCDAFQKYVTDTLTRENLTRWYVDQQMSMPDIKELVGLASVTPINNALRRFGISVRSISQSRVLPRQRTKGQATNVERHGAPHNFSKDHPSRQVWQARLLEEEGITNVFQRDDVKKKCTETLFRKYGVERIAHKPRFGRKSYTKQHQRVMMLLDRMGMEPVRELKLRYQNTFRSYDVYVKLCNLIIEVNGNYYHADPVKHKADDLIKFGKHNFRLASDIWARDAAKQEHARRLGYKVVVLWDETLKKMSDDELSAHLQQLINEQDRR